MVSKKKIREKYKKLANEVRRHQELYYTHDAPEISDEAYDSLVRELEKLEQKDPGLKEKYSVTERVGGEVVEELRKVRHEEKQLSLNNVFSFEELREWQDKTERIITRELFSAGEDELADFSISYVVEPKIDGLKVVLTYKKGNLILAATRGDGETGEDVTHNARAIKDIPQKLHKQIDITVVGEVWLSKKEFKRINREREKKNKSLFVNPRNAAAGALRQLDSNITRSRRLSVFVYDVDVINKRPDTQTEELELMEKLGLPVNDNRKHCKTIQGVEDYYQVLLKKRHSFEYDFDGVVVKINEQGAYDILEYTAKAPRYAVAYKFPAEQATTTVEDIVLQVGRTGVLTPVAHLKPVHVGGATITHATLHNEDFIQELDIRIGDTVILQRAGDVIPEVVDVRKSLRTGDEKKWTFPKKVAVCGGDGEIERVPGEAAWRCKHRGGFEQQKRMFEHFVSKKAFDIDGLGKEQVKVFLEEGLINEFADIFTLKEGDLLPLERFAEKSVENLLKAIDESREVPLHRLLVALSIDQVGEETARDVAERFGTLESVQKATKEELEAIDGVGPVVAESIYEWFCDKENKRILKNLLKEVNVYESRVPSAKSQALKGKTFVLTGTLKTMTRDEAKDKIRALGGSVSSSVSKNTNYVVAGKDPGSKYEKARELGVRIVGEGEFKKLIS